MEKIVNLLDEYLHLDGTAKLDFGKLLVEHLAYKVRVGAIYGPFPREIEMLFVPNHR